MARMGACVHPFLIALSLRRMTQQVLRKVGSEGMWEQQRVQVLYLRT